MPLSAGSRLGPYQIEDLLGEGGMGEVYKARDTRLDRSVAIKVLPSAFADDPTLRQRLEREARAVSALDHPNICALYDIGSENGLDFIVMQYLQGETLAARLERGPLSVGETCGMGAQIADALAAAHRRGIVHRDLKPGNIMIGRDGVRLLDFGLAKHHDAIGLSPDDKTVATPLTGARTIVGTLQYMAPEQLEGRTIDPRTDIFALGAVLYEMLTARPAFDGDSSASLITAIMTGRRAPISTLAPTAPQPLARIIERCLAPDPDDRWQSASDLAYALRSVRQNSEEGAIAAAAPRSHAKFGWRAAAAGILIAAVIAAVAFLSSRQLTPPRREIRLSIVPPSGLEFAADAADFDPDFALSPDGTRVAFIGVAADGKRSLWVRDLDLVVPREIAGTTDARQPFWSPDGAFIGYITRSGLTRIPSDGGSPISIPGSVSPSRNANAAWTFDGRIVYEAPAPGALGARAKALFVVSEGGGTATQLVAQAPVATEQAQRYPVPLPDGRHFLYLSWTSDPAERGIYVGTLDTGERKLLVKTGFRAEFIAPDLLVYIRDRAIVTQRFDVDEARLIGEPQHIAAAVALEAIPGQATFAVSRAGVIAYRSRERDVASELRWVDRSGRTEETFEPAADITVSLAPDGRRVAIARLDNSRLDDERFPSSVFLLDLPRRVQSRFTLGSGTTNENPIWSPDGSRIAYATHRGSGLAEVIVQRPGANGDTQVVATGGSNFHPIDWAEDGTLLLHSYATGTGADDLDLYTLEPGASAAPKPLIVAAGSQAQAQFSVDGRWIAYTSDESGQSEVYVQARGGGDSRVQVSSDGGGQPRWRGDSRELFYVSLTGTVMAVPLEVENGEPRPGRPVTLFAEPSLRTNNNLFFYGGAAGYDVTPDGQRFIVNRMTREPGAGPIHVVLNWQR
jgi:Tol biopolymer transport system component